MSDFDMHAADYLETMDETVGFFGQNHQFYIETKANILFNLIEKRLGSVSEPRILDVGCGVGTLDQVLAKKLTNVFGIDTSKESIKIAKKNLSSGNFTHYQGCRLPYEEGQFDLVFTVCVLHHVDISARHNFSHEMARVLRLGGVAVIIEHNPFNPLTRLAVNRCPFDGDAVLLNAKTGKNLLLQAGLVPVEKKYFTFLPFRHNIVPKLENLISWVPLGAQYYIAAIKK